MADFIPVLTVAIISLLGMFIIFGGYVNYTPETTESSGDVYYYTSDITLGSAFTVADYQSGTEVVEIIGNVSSGIVSKSDRENSFIVNDLNDVKYGRGVITVKDTNLYGSLIVMINDNVIYNNVTFKGIHTFRFDKSVLKDTDNTIVVKAAGSGWRIWAPTYYDVDVRIFGDESDNLIKEGTFDLRYVPEDARLNVYVTDRTETGNLIVKINGYRVSQGMYNVFKDFDTGILREGSNSYEIYAETGSKYNVQSAYISLE